MTTPLKGGNQLLRSGGYAGTVNYGLNLCYYMVLSAASIPLDHSKIL